MCPLQLQLLRCHYAKYHCPLQITSAPKFLTPKTSSSLSSKQLLLMVTGGSSSSSPSSRKRMKNYYISRTLLRSGGSLSRLVAVAASASSRPLDLTEENVEKVLEEAKLELSQLFDNAVGITGQAELADLDGPFVKLRLKGRFWHKRSTVLARLSNYLRKRIPEILEVDIEDEKQLDDSPENF